jgi:hypothetical protein
MEMVDKACDKNKFIRFKKSNLINSLFFEEFEHLFTCTDPSWEDIRMIFNWLKEEAQNARYFSDINAIDECRRTAEGQFSKFFRIKSKVCNNSMKVNRELRKRFDTLRETKKAGRGKLLSVIAYEQENNKTPPPR